MYGNVQLKEMIMQYDSEEEKVTDVRRIAYANKTDPLLNEARIKRLLGEDEEADSLEIEALSLREQIQTEFPYPTSVTEG